MKRDCRYWTDSCLLWLVQFFQRVGDLTLRQIVSAYNKPSVQGHVRNKEVWRCFDDSDSDEQQSVFVATMLTAPVTPTGDRIDGIVLKHQCWTLVREESGMGSGGDRVVTLVRSYHRITCVDLAKGFEWYWTPPALLDSLAPMWYDTLSRLRRELESSLIDQSILSRCSTCTV